MSALFPLWLGPELRPLATSLTAALDRLPASGRRPAEGLRDAAVLVPILCATRETERSDPELLFLIRPETMSSHGGQVAFPGGRVDPEDRDVIAAALREAEEEVGIQRALPHVLGTLPQVPTPSGYLITPVVALIPGDVTLTPSAAEVASFFTEPLPRLRDPSLRRTMLGRRGPAGSPLVPLHFWVHTPAVIWGATGHILDGLLRRLAPDGGPPHAL